MKIIILVLSAEFEPYSSLESTIRKTWARETLPEIEIFYYYGNSSSKKIVEDKIYSTAQEGLYNIGYKTLDSFDLLKNFNFDYLFRTNSSSYIIQENLIKFLANKPRKNFYSGIIGNYNDISYCSGSGYFISRDIFDKVLFHRNEWNHQLIDDVAIGDLITNKIKVLPDFSAKRLDLGSEKIYDSLKDHYHIRCKIQNNRKLDELHMKNIFNMLSEKQCF